MACWNDDKDIASMPHSWRTQMLSTMAASKSAVILTETEQSNCPGAIVACNAAWNKLCGYSPEEALGKTTSILQGRLTSTHKARRFTHQCIATRIYGNDNGFASRQATSSVKLINYSRSGRPFVHCLKSRRIADEDTGVEYYMTESHEETDEKIIRAMFRGEDVPRARNDEAWGALVYLVGLLLIFIPTLSPMWRNLL